MPGICPQALSVAVTVRFTISGDSRKTIGGKQLMANKWVYLFSEGDATMRNLLGGKGANLAEMTKFSPLYPYSSFAF